MNYNVSNGLSDFQVLHCAAKPEENSFTSCESHVPNCSELFQNLTEIQSFKENTYVPRLWRQPGAKRQLLVIDDDDVFDDAHEYVIRTTNYIAPNGNLSWSMESS